MRIDNIFDLARGCIVLGIGISVVGFLVYFFKYKKRYNQQMNGKKIINRSTYIWKVLVIWYFLTILYVTLCYRDDIYVRKIRPIFSSYYEAWCTWSVTNWRNIILNYCLFIPYGFLIPLKIRFFRKIHLVGLSALLFSTVIESIQVISKIGVFEVDDLIGNTLGALIGFGLYGVYDHVVLKKKRGSIKKTIFLQMPLLLLVIGYCSMLMIYSAKTLGNNINDFYYGYDPEELLISTEIPLSKKEITVKIYKTDVLSLQQASELAESKLENYAVHVIEERENVREVYENHMILKVGSDGSQPSDDVDISTYYSGPHIASCEVTYRGGFYKCMISEGAKEIEKTNEMRDTLDEKTIMNMLTMIGEKVPDNYTFEKSQSLRCLFNYDGVPLGDKYLFGYYACIFDGKTLRKIENHISYCEYVGERKIISQQEAYKRILEGKFRIPGENISKGIFNASLFEIKVIGVTLEYEIDSKGYLQPQYRFMCFVNGKAKDIIIPCLK